MENLVSATRKHDITFHRSGRIDISARLAKLLSLAPGDSVMIAKDCGEYYIYVSHRASQSDMPYRGKVYHANSNGDACRLQFKPLALEVIKQCGCTANVLRLPTGSPRRTMLSDVSVPIITLTYTNN